MRTYLTAARVWDKTREETLLKECSERVQAAAQAYIETPPPPPTAMFEHLYETLPPALASQRAELEAGSAQPDNAAGSGAEQV